MKLFLTVLMASVGLAIGKADQAAVEKKGEKASILFQGKAYFLGDNISAGKTMLVNFYYREGKGPGQLGAHLSQRFVLTKDDAKTVANNMAESFKKTWVVTLVNDVSPGIIGIVTTDANEKASFVRVSIFEQAKNKKGVFVKAWDISAPAMTKEKLEAIAAKFQKSTFDALVKAKFPRIVLPKKKAVKPKE